MTNNKLCKTIVRKQLIKPSNLFGLPPIVLRFVLAIARSRWVKLGVGSISIPLLLGATAENKVTSTDLFLGIGAILAGICIHIALGWLWNRAQQKLEGLLAADGVNPEHSRRVSQAPPQTLTLLLKLSRLFLQLFLWISILLYLAHIFPESRSWSQKIAATLTTSLTSPIFAVGRNGYSVVNIIILGLLILALIILAGIVTNILRGRVLSALSISRGAQEAIATIARYTLIVLGTVVILQIWGLDLSSLTIVASALGVGIGFGLQDIAKNFGSGLVLIFERPIQVGDFVEVGKYTGTVEKIGSRSTLIRTLDRVSIIVPNSRFLESEIVNWSHQGSISRIHIPVGVAYGSEVNLVKQALLEAADGVPHILSSPSAEVRLIGFGDSSINFELLVWTDLPSRQLVIKSDLYFQIEDTLKQYHIQVPFPQQDLHFRSGSLPVEVSPQLEKILLNLSKLIDTKQK